MHTFAVAVSQPFWPQTFGAWAAVAAATFGAAASTLGYRNRKHIQEVHVLVNSNLVTVKEQLAERTDERDQLQAAVDERKPDAAS